MKLLAVAVVLCLALQSQGRGYEKLTNSGAVGPFRPQSWFKGIRQIRAPGEMVRLLKAFNHKVAQVVSCILVKLHEFKRLAARLGWTRLADFINYWVNYVNTRRRSLTESSSQKPDETIENQNQINPPCSPNDKRPECNGYDR